MFGIIAFIAAVIGIPAAIIAFVTMMIISHSEYLDLKTAEQVSRRGFPFRKKQSTQNAASSLLRQKDLRRSKDKLLVFSRPAGNVYPGYDLAVLVAAVCALVRSKAAGRGLSEDERERIAKTLSQGLENKNPEQLFVDLFRLGNELGYRFPLAFYEPPEPGLTPTESKRLYTEKAGPLISMHLMTGVGRDVTKSAFEAEGVSGETMETLFLTGSRVENDAIPPVQPQV